MKAFNNYSSKYFYLFQFISIIFPSISTRKSIENESI